MTRAMPPVARYSGQHQSGDQGMQIRRLEQDMTDKEIPSPNPEINEYRDSVSDPEQDLAAAMARMTMAVSPQAARALQATENTWRTIDKTFGLLSSGQVASLLGHTATDRAHVSRLRTGGRLLGVRRLNAYRYPGFQFDAYGHIEPAIADLAGLAKKMEWMQEDVVLWLCAPSGYFTGDRPVDHLHEPEVLLTQAAKNAFLTQW